MAVRIYIKLKGLVRSYSISANKIHKEKLEEKRKRRRKEVMVVRNQLT